MGIPLETKVLLCLIDTILASYPIFCIKMSHLAGWGGDDVRVLSQEKHQGAEAERTSGRSGRRNIRVAQQAEHQAGAAR